MLNQIFILISIFIIFICDNKIIITFSTNHDNIYNIHKIINSILEQNVNKSLYKILLILSKNEFKHKRIPKELNNLLKENKFRLLFYKGKLTLQTKLILAIKEYPSNPILVINDNIIFPEGWLNMFINDMNKYPNDIIVGSIQFFFGNNYEIKEFEEGYKGKKFGIFNHVPNMIFNFAIINNYLGGTLYPPYTFQNKDFYNEKLFLDISKDSDDFWQSCFIILDGKILRQSSKIYDYTKYIINYFDFTNKIKNYDIIKKKFLITFPMFGKILDLRQNKFIACITSYPERYEFLPFVINSIKSQSKPPAKIILYLSKRESRKLKIKIKGIEIIKVENIKPHKKYYYAMKKYKNYAIITFDDDVIYPYNFIESLINSYITYPNIISGRRSHYMLYENNKELKIYNNWILTQRNFTTSSFDIFLTGVGGIIYPPDILNIDEHLLPLIKETITTDDILLKHLEMNKGIESIWIQNDYLSGVQMLENNKHKPLYKLNMKSINDINIKKLNINTNYISLDNLCVKFKNSKTGISIYLFNMRKNKYQGSLGFFIIGFSFCPIDSNIQFNIYFGDEMAKCNFIEKYSIIKENNMIFKTIKILKAFCKMSKNILIHKYKFPLANSTENLDLQVYYYEIYSPIIFYTFFCINLKICFLKAIFYKTLEKGYIINIKIKKTAYICKLENDVFYKKESIPKLESFKCYKKKNHKNSDYMYIAGIKNEQIGYISHKFCFQNQFEILYIFHEDSIIFLKGKLKYDLRYNISDLMVLFIYPDKVLKCQINISTKQIYSYIKCFYNGIIDNRLYVGNQIAFNKGQAKNIIIVNKEIFYQNYIILNKNKIIHKKMDEKNYLYKFLFILYFFKLFKYFYYKLIQ